MLRSLIVLLPLTMESARECGPVNFGLADAMASSASAKRWPLPRCHQRHFVIGPLLRRLRVTFSHWPRTRVTMTKRGWRCSPRSPPLLPDCHRDVNQPELKRHVAVYQQHSRERKPFAQKAMREVACDDNATLCDVDLGRSPSGQPVLQAAVVEFVKTKNDTK